MAATTAHSPGAQSTTATQTYVVDALEMPSKHLASDPMLEQALNITEAGVLVYDVSDPKSLQLVIGIAEFVKEYLDNVNGKPRRSDHDQLFFFFLLPTSQLMGGELGRRRRPKLTDDNCHLHSEIPSPDPNSTRRK